MLKIKGKKKSWTFRCEDEGSQFSVSFSFPYAKDKRRVYTDLLDENGMHTVDQSASIDKILTDSITGWEGISGENNKFLPFNDTNKIII